MGAQVGEDVFRGELADFGPVLRPVGVVADHLERKAFFYVKSRYICEDSAATMFVGRCDSFCRTLGQL